MTAVERREDRLPVNVGGRIESFDEVYRLAQNLATAGLMPRDLRGKPADVTAIILFGQDLGLSPMQAIQGIYVVEGRPSLSAQLWLALVRRAGHRVSVIEHTAETCTVRVVRGDTGEEHVTTWTFEQAVRAGLVAWKDGKPYARSSQGKPLPWELHTKAMLLARAVSECCRFIAPEIALGFYSPDEVEEIADRECVEAERIDVQAPSAADGVRRPEQVAADVEALEAEFVEEPPTPRPDGRTAISAGHQIDLIPSTSLDTDDAWRWLCDTCLPGQDDASVAMPYEDALADHAHFAATHDQEPK